MGNGVAPAHPTRHLWLIGMMGAGKSTVGALLAERFAAAFDDTDRMVEDATAMELGSLWAIDDGDTFRLAEAAAVAAAAASSEPRVIAAGGGAVLDAESAERMNRSGVVVWLEAGPPELAARVSGGSHRPLLAGDAPDATERLAAILEQRSERYRAVA
ncbi:MAG: shikimate kinase, partial [Acidimicrobiia bacterium]